MRAFHVAGDMAAVHFTENVPAGLRLFGILAPLRMARMKKSPLKMTMALAPAAHRAPFGKSMTASGSSLMVLRGARRQRRQLHDDPSQ